MTVTYEKDHSLLVHSLVFILVVVVVMVVSLLGYKLKHYFGI